MVDKVMGNKCNYITLQVLNFLTFCLGIAILYFSLIICEKVRSFNTFILSLIFVSFIIICVTILGYRICYSPTRLIIYFISVFILAMGLLILLLYLIYDKDQIVSFLLLKMKDSFQAIEAAKLYLDHNIDLIKILLWCYSIILVIY